MAEKRLTRREAIRLLGATAATGVLAACQPQVLEKVVRETVEVEKVVRETVPVEKLVKETVVVAPTAARDALNLPNAATGIPYEVKPQINDGKPIKLTYWEWAGFRAVYEKKWAQEYMSIYPNVTIEITTVPWDEYWTKIFTNVPAGQGPDLFHFHTDHFAQSCTGNLLDPMPDYVADQAFLTENWVGFKEGAFDCNGKRFFVPMGLQLPLLFINQKIWEEAGLTEKDVPKSWDQAREIAKKLTKTDSAGRIVQAGLLLDPYYAVPWLQWQQGRYLFTSDKRRAQIDTPETLKAVKFIQDLNTTDKVTDPNFPSFDEAFPSGQAAMIVSMSYLVSVLRRTAPDLQWFVALTPTWSGTPKPTLGLMHFAVEAAVNAFAPADRKKVAWDFWHFAYSNDQRLVNDIALYNGMIPAYKKLQAHPAVKADPVATVLASGVDYGLLLGEYPAVLSDIIRQQVLDAVLVGGVAPETALKSAQRAADQELAKRSWNVLERNYRHADLMLPGQP